MCRLIKKLREARPNFVDVIANGEIDIVFNTTEGSKSVVILKVAPLQCYVAKVV